LFAVLLLGSLARAQDAGAAVPRIWHVPGAIEAVDVPGRTDAFGTPVAMHAVRSRLPIDQLAGDFVHQFERAGLFIPPAGALFASSSHLQLTGLDPDTFIAYTVFFQENPDHTTTAILTEAFLAERKRSDGRVEFAPVMPRARDLLVTQNEGLELAHYRVHASPAEIDAFHKQALAQAGYRQIESGVWQHGVDVLKFSFKADDDGAIEVLVMHRRAPNADVAPLQGDK
jgi:hypothetical protein